MAMIYTKYKVTCSLKLFRTNSLYHPPIANIWLDDNVDPKNWSVANANITTETVDVLFRNKEDAVQLQVGVAMTTNDNYPYRVDIDNLDYSDWCEIEYWCKQEKLDYYSDYIDDWGTLDAWWWFKNKEHAALFKLTWMGDNVA